MRTVALISGGKDSCYNMLQCVAEGHEIVALANLKPKDKDEVDSYMYQSVGHHAIELYAEAMGLPLFRRTIEGASVSTGSDYQRTEDDEVEDLYKLLTEVKEAVHFEAVSVGAVLSDYQRVRVENVCSRLGLTSLAYLWRRDQKELLDEMIQCDVKAILIKVATLGLVPDKHLGQTLTQVREHLHKMVSEFILLGLVPDKHLGQTLTQVREQLHKMNEKYSLNVCGEGGEYETFTLDCPLFNKEIILDEMETVIHSDDAFAPVGYLNLKKAHLKDKVGDPKRSQLECVKDLPMKTSCSLPRELFSDGEKVRCIQCEAIQMQASEDIANESIPWIKRTSGDHIWIAGITVKYEDGVPIETLVSQTMTQLQDCLQSSEFDMSCLTLVHLYVQKMEDFAAINTVYKQFFGLNPPARVCVQVCLRSNIAMQMDCHGYRIHNNRKTMHVQGLSHWAPANIGPYSQAVMINDKIYVAGQIGMIPANLSLIGGGIHPQCRLSLRHVDRVLRAMCSGCCVDNVVTCVCYVAHPDYIQVAREEWNRACQNRLCSAVYVVVPYLPKAALVEWQVVASQTSSCEHKEYSRCDTEDGIEVKVLCVCNNGSLISSNCYICRRASNKTNVQDIIQVFLKCYRRVINEAKISWSELPMMRIFYLVEDFKFDQLNQVLSSSTDGLPFSIVPVYQLEGKNILMSVCQ